MRLLLSCAVLFLASRSANAACTIGGARPTVPLPTMELGQEFSFVASNDCEALRFTIGGTALSKKPRSSGPVGPGPHTYKVVLTESEWDAVVAESGSTLTWIVTGTGAGLTTQLVTTNDLKRYATIHRRLSNADAKLRGEETDDFAGYSVSGAGDVDGDGNADLLVGAFQNDEGGAAAGAAYLVRGPVTGTLDLSMADAKLVGEEPGDQAGGSVSGAGDVDGDGHDDLLVGAAATGAAYLVCGPVTGVVDLSAADAKLEGERGDHAGLSVSGAGDVDRDGNADLLVGAPTHLSPGAADYAGAAYLVLGPVTGIVDLSAADAEFVGDVTGELAGMSVSGAGDVDGDGHDDFLVGMPGRDTYGPEFGIGAAFLVLGPVTGTLDASMADAELVGEGDAYDCEGAGAVVSGAGDVDADGHDDFLVVAPNDDGDGAWGGAAYLLLGPVTGTRSLAEADAKLLGPIASHTSTASDAGDVDADGHDDVLVGAYQAETDTRVPGAAYLVLGPVTGTVDLSHADAVFTGESVWGLAGWSVSGAGDVDADGHDDLLVGAPTNHDTPRSGPGAAYLVNGGGLF